MSDREPADDPNACPAAAAERQAANGEAPRQWPAASPKTRLYIINFSFFPSQFALGPATATLDLAREMRRYYEVVIITLNFDFATGRPMFPSDGDVVECAMEGVTVRYLPYSPSRFGYLYRLIAGGDGILHIKCAFDYRLAMPALVLNRFFNRRPRKTTHMPHGIFLPAVMGQKSMKKILFCRFADLIDLYAGVRHVATSPEEEHDIRRAFRRRQDVVVIPHFLGMTIGREDPAPRLEGGLSLCFVGRIARQKNVAGALRILERAEVPCRFDVIGEITEEDYFRECQRIAERLPGTVEVRFVGLLPRTELLKGLGSYDAMLFPTLGENHGHAIIEALASGVPVIASDRVPWRDMEVRGAGWSIPLDDIDRFGAAIRQVAAQSPEERAAIRKAARSYAKSKTDPEPIRRKYHALFEDVAVDAA